MDGRRGKEKKGVVVAAAVFIYLLSLQMGGYTWTGYTGVYTYTCKYILSQLCTALLSIIFNCCSESRMDGSSPSREIPSALHKAEKFLKFGKERKKEEQKEEEKKFSLPLNRLKGLQGS